MRCIRCNSKGKKLIFFILYAVSVIALFEFLSFVIYSRIRPIDSYNKEQGITGIFDHRVNYVLHPYFGFSRDPAVCRSGEYNRFGFIGAELPEEKMEDTIVIGIFGGSLAGNLCAYNMQPFSKKLQRHTFFKNKKIQFTCIALGGFKQPQQLLALSYFLALGLKFDIVVNLDGFNEICLPVMENIPAHVEYSYPRMWNMYVRQKLNTLALMQIERIEQIRRSKKNLQILFSRGIFAHSYFLKVIQATFDRLEMQKNYGLYQYLLKKSEKEEFGEYQVYGPREEYKGIDEMMKKSVALWKKSSQQMAYLCNANNIFYFHFLQPNQYYSGTKRLSPRERQIAYSSSSPYKNAVERGYSLLVQEGKNLRKEGIHFFDLTTIFMNETKDIYADDCCHVNALGNEILMETITNTIVSYLPQNSSVSLNYEMSE